MNLLSFLFQNIKYKFSTKKSFKNLKKNETEKKKPTNVGYMIKINESSFYHTKRLKQEKNKSFLKKINFNQSSRTPIIEDKKGPKNRAFKPLNKCNVNQSKAKVLDFYQSLLLSFFDNCTYNEKRIFYAISFFLKKYNKQFFISQSKIAKKVGCHRNTVTSFIKKLKDFGIVINQKRNRAGRFSSCNYKFTFDFKYILNSFVRFNFFKDIQKKSLYRKKIRERIVEIRRLLSKYGSFKKIFESWNAWKSMTYKIVHGEYINNILNNITYKPIRFIKKKTVISPKMKAWFSKLKLPDHEISHFSSYPEAIIIFVKEKFDFWLARNSMHKIRNLPRFLQFLFNLGTQYYKTLKTKEI